MSKPLLFFLFVSTVFFSFSAYAGDLSGVLKNNQGVRKFSSEKASEAFDSFTDALGELPFAGEVHFNIGNAFLRDKEFTKALSEYAQAMRYASGESRREREVRFKALFNSAVALTETKQIDQALELYQQALEIQPDSIETKTNVELLSSQGGGEGEGDKDSDGKEGDKNKDQKDGQGKKDKEKQQPQKFENPKRTPRPYDKDKELNEKDVKRILEELKRQEEQIRARMQQQQNMKDAPAGKDW